MATYKQQLSENHQKVFRNYIKSSKRSEQEIRALINLYSSIIKDFDIEMVYHHSMAVFTFYLKNGMLSQLTNFSTAKS